MHPSNTCDIHTCCVVRSCLYGNKINGVLCHLQNVVSRANIASDFVVRCVANDCTENGDSSDIKPEVVPINNETSSETNVQGSEINWWNMGLPVLYGYMVSVNKSHHLYFCDRKAMSTIKGLLALLHIEHAGVASPYLHVFEERVVLAWHIEDGVPSDDLPHKSCKRWFVLPQKYVSVLNTIVTNLLEPKICVINSINLLGQSYLPDNLQSVRTDKISVSMIIHDPFEWGTLCPDKSSSASLHPQTLKCVREVRFAGGDTVVTSAFWGFIQNCYKPLQQLSPESDASLIHVQSEELSTDITVEEGIVAKHDMEEKYLTVEHEQEHAGKFRGTNCSDTEIDSDSSDCTLRTVCTCVGSVLLQCPACSEVFKGGINRVERLHLHITDKHEEHKKSLMKNVRKIYPIRPCPLNLEDSDQLKLIREARFCSLRPPGEQSGLSSQSQSPKYVTGKCRKRKKSKPLKK
ncbi:hypothetical protein ONE63_011186 [Megalurothrips usitatus]|uniref:C2H2-type domain-containing protein n=1 Tax=Megalurothrips usitatus TaxID=439358 RepID=A0AAV7X3S0_9NEOP|nr:hypothetical protein ONE63_011186 [Megalurothrips usitatus]